MIDCGIGKGGCGGRSPHTLMTNKPIFRGHGPKSFSAYGPKNLNPALIKMVLNVIVMQLHG